MPVFALLSECTCVRLFNEWVSECMCVCVGGGRIWLVFLIVHVWMFPCVFSTPKFTWSSCLTEIVCPPYFVSCLHTDTYVVVVIPNCEYITNRTDAVVTRIVYIDEILCVCKYYYFFQRSSNVKLVMIHRCVCLYKGYLYMFVLYSSICLHWLCDRVWSECILNLWGYLYEQITRNESMIFFLISCCDILSTFLLTWENFC